MPCRTAAAGVMRWWPAPPWYPHAGRWGIHLPRRGDGAAARHRLRRCRAPIADRGPHQANPLRTRPGRGSRLDNPTHTRTGSKGDALPAGRHPAGLDRLAPVPAHRHLAEWEQRAHGHAPHRQYAERRGRGTRLRPPRLGRVRRPAWLAGGTINRASRPRQPSGFSRRFPPRVSSADSAPALPWPIPAMPGTSVAASPAPRPSDRRARCPRWR